MKENDWFTLTFFLAAALLTVGGATAVAVTKKIMHACVSLLISLLGVAGLYVTLGAEFVAATQLVVYVGGVVILMVFAVMLTGGGVSQKANVFGLVKTPMMGNRRTYIVAGIGVALMGLFLYKIVVGVLQHHHHTATLKKLEPHHHQSTVDGLGMLLISDHILAFEMASVLLLGALIGAAVIARPQKRGMGK